jgi:NAD+ synthase
MSLANSRARLRMTTLYNLAGAVNGLVVGTGNKVEDFGVGFYTKYGDGGVDISPIADLLKSEVYDIANQLGINKEIIEAQPTDGLWDDGRTDEDQLGISYKELEWAMNFIEEDKDPSVLSEKGLKTLETFKYWNNLNKHKMVPIPVWKKS